MIEKIKAMVLASPDYTILIHGPDARENIRAAYTLALNVAGLPMDHKEQPFDMFKRVGEFIFAVEHTLKEIGAEFCDEIGFEPDVVGNIDFLGLPKEHALRLFNVHHALHHVEKIKSDICQELIAYSPRRAQDE